MNWIKKLFGKKEKKQAVVTTEVQTESTIEHTQQILDNAHKLINELKWREVAQKNIPIAEKILKEIQTINNLFEQAKTPEQLESYKEQLLALLCWFIQQEQEYPDAPWLLKGVGTATKMLSKVRSQYNSLLLNLAVNVYKEDLQGYIDLAATNGHLTRIEMGNALGFNGDIDEDLLEKTASLNNQGITLEREGKVEEAIKVYEENITLGYPAHHSYDRLRILYNKRKDEENEKRILKLTIEKFGANPKIQKRLDKLNGIEPIISLPTEAREANTKEPTLGQQYEKAILNIPEFNFYFDMPDDMNTIEYLYKHPKYTQLTEEKKLLFEIRDSLEELISLGAELENEGKLDEASVIYEQAIAHKSFKTEPYDRLIKIYSKAKLKKEEERVLTEAISHFKELREKRREYVLGLATKYGKLEFANERISNEMKIMYFGGAFDLYNPYTIIDKWEHRLEKLINKKK